MIHVVAAIATKPGQRAAVLRLLKENVPAVLAEAGCIEYGAVVDVPDGPALQAPLGSDSFFVIEKWDSMAALSAHIASPHMAVYAQKTRELLASRAVHILTDV
jgi:quinol monooxygenase YgiN